MDLKNLQCFVAVAEHLNFSRAAESLYISQPSLSIRVNALEEELGADLFHRTRQQVYLTPAGACLLPEVRDILARIDALPQLARSVLPGEREPSERLLVGLDPMEERTDLPFLVETFETFRTRWPNVSIECASVDFGHYREKLLSGEFDICLMILRPNDEIDPQFASAPLLREPLVLFAVDAGDAGAEELLQTRELLILEHEDIWNRKVLGYLASRKLKVRIKKVRATPAMCMTLRNGKTAAFLPLTYAEGLDLGRTSMFDMKIPNSTVTFTAIWNKQNLKPAIQNMINELTRATEGKVDQSMKDGYCGIQ